MAKTSLELSIGMMHCVSCAQNTVDFARSCPIAFLGREADGNGRRRPSGVSQGPPATGSWRGRPASITPPPAT